MPQKLKVSGEVRFDNTVRNVKRMGVKVKVWEDPRTQMTIRMQKGGRSFCRRTRRAYFFDRGSHVLISERIPEPTEGCRTRMEIEMTLLNRPPEIPPLRRRRWWVTPGQGGW